MSEAHNPRAAAVFSGPLTIYEAAQTKASLLALLPGTGPVLLDLSQVSEFDTAGLQLLLLLRREALLAGRTVHVTAASGVVQEVLALLRLSAALGLGEAATPASSSLQEAMA